MGLGIKCAFQFVSPGSSNSDVPACLDVWSFEEDGELRECNDYLFIAAISGLRGDGRMLIPLRGLPSDSSALIQRLKGELVTGWLTYPEIIASLEFKCTPMSALCPSVVRLLDTMAFLEQRLGKGRLRLVFAILV